MTPQAMKIVPLQGKETDNFFFFFFLLLMNTERAQCDLSRVCIPYEKEKEGNEKNETKG